MLGWSPFHYQHYSLDCIVDESKYILMIYNPDGSVTCRTREYETYIIIQCNDGFLQQRLFHLVIIGC